MAKKDFEKMDRNPGSTAARDAMAARYTRSADPISLPVASIAHNPRNRRSAAEYADAKAQGLASTIRVVGVLQALGVVRRAFWEQHYADWITAHPESVAELGAAEWVVMWGNRRLAAARIAGLGEVPVRVQDQIAERDSGGGDTLHVAALIENIHQRKLEPLVEAADVRELVDLHGDRPGAKGAVAELLGKSGGWVTQRLNLLNLLPELQAALRSGDLHLEQARALGAIDPSRQMEAWQAGPPYRDPAKKTKPPRGKAAVAVSKEPPPGDANQRNSAAAPTVDFYAVKPDASENGDRAHASPSSGAATTTAPRLPSAPSELAHAIKSQLGADAVRELIRLLQ